MKRLEYRYTLGDKSWTLDFARLTVDDYIELKKVTGFNVTRLVTEYDDWNPLVLKAVVWMARRKSGEDIAWDDPATSFTLTELDITVLHDDTASDTEPGDESGTESADAKPRPTKARNARQTQTSKNN